MLLPYKNTENIFDLSKVGRIKQETDNCLLSPPAVIQADRALITLTQLKHGQNIQGTQNENKTKKVFGS